METLDNYKIDGETAVKDFPDKYNALIDELVTEIGKLRREISEKEVTISQLRTDFNITLSAIRSECLRKIDALKEQIEELQQPSTSGSSN